MFTPDQSSLETLNPRVVYQPPGPCIREELSYVVRNDGLQLAFRVTGDPDGKVVCFSMHGTPSCRRDSFPDQDKVLRELGIRHIAYDRPGFGGSNRRPSRRVVDCAEDVATIADALDVDHFWISGRSGGGPHALACAAVMPDRVDRALIMASPAPKSETNDEDWFKGMTAANKADAKAPDIVSAVSISFRPNKIRADDDYWLKVLEPAMHETDRRVLGNLALRKLIAAAHFEAVVWGHGGWVDDHVALRKPWGFKLRDVEVPVYIWHGEQDVFNPITHAEIVVKKLIHAPVVYTRAPNAGHFSAFEVYPDLLTKMMQES